MIIIFANDKEIPYIKATETSTYYDNATRRTLLIEFHPSAIPLAELNSLVSDANNTSEITLINPDEFETPVVNVYSDYSIKMELSQKPTAVSVDENGAEIKEERVFVQLGRLTPTEIALKKLGVNI